MATEIAGHSNQLLQRPDGIAGHSNQLLQRHDGIVGHSLFALSKDQQAGYTSMFALWMPALVQVGFRGMMGFWGGGGGIPWASGSDWYIPYRRRKK